MNDLDRDVADEQMTHSDEPTTEKERELWLRDPTMAFDVDPISRLCTDVERLETENKRLRKSNRALARAALKGERLQLDAAIDKRFR